MTSKSECKRLANAQPTDFALRYHRLREAAEGVRALYPLHWDRTDGSATIFPDRVPQFEAAFAALAKALDEA